MTLSNPPFYKRTDWIACWITFAISLIVYTLTLQPTVGLEDSGELIVASDFLGVPHPPAIPSGLFSLGFFNGFSTPSPSTGNLTLPLVSIFSPPLPARVPAELLRCSSAVLVKIYSLA